MSLVNTRLILPGKITFCKTEIMNGIKEVGFSKAIASANTYNPFGKMKFLLEIIFKLVK